MHLIIGSRGSDLALYQANLVRSYLMNMGVDIEVKIIKTVGDKIDNLSFDLIEGKGFFTKELEDALLNSEIDLAVHSLKDLSTMMPEGLKVGAYCNPEDPSELLLVRPESYDAHAPLFLRQNCTIGTSSVRRQAQIAHHRPDLKIEPLRGNVPTRVQKLKDGKYDAVLIARAGVERLKLDTVGLMSFVLDRFDFIPAPGQGLLTIEIRENDPDVEQYVSRLNEGEAETTALLERGLLARFQGGCQLPLAVTSTRRSGGSYLKAFLGVREGDNWARPALFAGYGPDITELIERAYRKLSQSTDPSYLKSKVLITRTEEESAPFFSSFADDFEPVYYPVFEISPSFDVMEAKRITSNLSEFNWIIFTSKNGVRIFKNIADKFGEVVNPQTKIAAVGKKTAAYIDSLGWKTAFMPEQEDSAGLIEELPKIMRREEASVLLPQGHEAPDLLEKGLRVMGYKITRFNIYETLPAPAASLPRIDPQNIKFFIFTSPLSVEYFKNLGHPLPDNSWVAAIGRPTAETLARLYRRPDFVPEKADIGVIVQKIKELL